MGKFTGTSDFTLPLGEGGGVSSDFSTPFFVIFCPAICCRGCWCWERKTHATIFQFAVEQHDGRWNAHVVLIVTVG
jgi:hypothetical protein